MRPSVVARPPSTDTCAASVNEGPSCQTTLENPNQKQASKQAMNLDLSLLLCAGRSQAEQSGGSNRSATLLLALRLYPSGSDIVVVVRRRALKTCGPAPARTCNSALHFPIQPCPSTQPFPYGRIQRPIRKNQPRRESTVACARGAVEPRQLAVGPTHAFALALPDLSPLWPQPRQASRRDRKDKSGRFLVGTNTTALKRRSLAGVHSFRPARRILHGATADGLTHPQPDGQMLMGKGSADC